MTILNYNDVSEIIKQLNSLSLVDIENIHKNFIQVTKNFKNLSNSEKRKEIVNCKKYLNTMSIIFSERYKKSQISPEEYEIWKISLKENFNDIPTEIKEEIKKEFILKISEIIKSKILNGNDLTSYDKYYIDDIREIKLNEVTIHYKYRIMTMLIFAIVIMLIVLFIH